MRQLLDRLHESQAAGKRCAVLPRAAARSAGPLAERCAAIPDRVGRAVPAATPRGCGRAGTAAGKLAPQVLSYNVEVELGHGGMGVVQRRHHLHRGVALKCCWRRHAQPERERFLRGGSGRRPRHPTSCRSTGVAAWSASLLHAELVEAAAWLNKSGTSQPFARRSVGG